MAWKVEYQEGRRVEPEVAEMADGSVARPVVVHLVGHLEVVTVAARGASRGVEQSGAWRACLEVRTAG